MEPQGSEFSERKRVQLERKRKKYKVRESFRRNTEGELIEKIRKNKRGTE